MLRADFKTYVLRYPSADPLIIVIQVMLKFLSKLGMGLWACIHTALWEWINHVTAFKFLWVSHINVTPDGLRGNSLPHPKVNHMHSYVYYVSHTLFFPFWPSPSVKQGLQGVLSLLQRTRPQGYWSRQAIVLITHWPLDSFHCSG